MNFEVDRYSSAWAHIALCADLTWATEPPDDFIIANQRLWTQHCRVAQVLQESTEINNQCESNDKRVVTNQDNENSSGRRSVKDVIPESRLAQYYGNFYYDEARENCYTNTMERSPSRNFCTYSSENSDLTECWMLPEVEYWFRKLLDEPADRSAPPRRRRQYRMLNEDDFERWSPGGAPASDEATLEARIRGVRALWNPTHVQTRRPRVPSPPPIPRKIRARRRQPRRINALAPPPPPYCLDVPAQLFCDPTCKFQFESPRPPQLIDCQRAMGRLSASVQAVIRATAARCQPYRGTNVTRYAPTGQRPVRCHQDRRCNIWWPRDHPSPRLEQRFHLNTTPNAQLAPKLTAEDQADSKSDVLQNYDKPEEQPTADPEPSTNAAETPDTISSQREKLVVDGQMPCTSSASVDAGVRKKRLYSTVLSMSPPSPINLAASGCVRLSQKLVTPGLLRLNPKIILPTRLRPPNNDKFEELEKEALEQYKASDESIDTKFRELEKQAVEQYSTSNSNTSCSSGNSAEKKGSGSSVTTENGSQNNKKTLKFHKEKSVDSVVIYSQNFPDLNAKAQTNGSTNLKNFHNPPRGEKKDHKMNKSLRNLKCDTTRAASDTDYDAKESKINHKGPIRWPYHTPPKKRHLALCVSDFSSDEDLEDAAGSIKDAGPRMKNRATGKITLSAHGGGDLNPIMRKV